MNQLSDRLLLLLLAWGMAIVSGHTSRGVQPPVSDETTAVDTNQLSTPEKRPPNVVVIFIDDMGYADIGPFGATHPTPNLDRMAAQGRKFTDFVVSSAVCSPSRLALMTGCYHQRLGIYNALVPNSETGISSDEVTLAEVCKSRGYATACFGKWHLGHHPRFLPTQHGFDVFYGIPYSNDMWPLHPDDLARREKNPQLTSQWPPLPMLKSCHDGPTQVVIADMQPADQQQMTRQFTERSVEFIRNHVDKPFFLYLPHPMVHVPLYVSEAFEGKSGAGLFADVVMEVDWSVGQILDTIDELGLGEQTLIVFTSDNGPWLSYGNHAGSAGELREGKGTMFEGGYRVPTLMRWTGTIPAGTVCDQLSSTIDLLPTVASLIGADLPEHPIDGRVMTRLLTDNDAASPHDYFFCYYGQDNLHAVRTPRWKLHLPHSYRTLAGGAGGRDGKPVPYKTGTTGLELYDLMNDFGEIRDVSNQHPEIVEELLAAAAKAKAELGDPTTRTRGTGIRSPGRMTAEDERATWSRISEP